MLYFILIWSLLLCVSFITGIGLLKFFQITGVNRAGHRFFVSSWLGLVFLANIFLAISLFTPLSPFIGLLVLSVIAVSILSFSVARTEVVNTLLKVSDRWLLITTCIGIIAATFTSQQVSWFDTGLYHFGSIRWLADYGAVPGIALLNNGFAFVSSWFALAAPFNPDFMGSRNTAVLNGYLLFLLLLQAGIAGHYILTKTATKLDWFIVIYSLITLPLFVFTPFLSAVLISPSPDFPVILITGVVAWTILGFSKDWRQDDKHGQTMTTKCLKSNTAIVPLLLGVGAVTFKLNGLPVLGVVLLYYITHHRLKPVLLLLGTGLTLLLLAPMFIFGIVTSGCPLYPSSWMCVSVPWALSTQQATNALSRINGWQDWFGTPPSDTNVWLWTFSQWLQLSHLNKVMVFLAVAAIPIIIWIFKQAKKNQNAAEIWLIALSLLGMGFILSQAPLIRFGLGYFVLLPTLMISTLCTQASRNTHDFLRRFFKLYKATSLFTLFFVALLYLGFSKVKLSQQLAVPPELPTVTVNLVQINDIEYFLPVNTNKCWGSAIPCVPEPLATDIWLRNPEQGVAAGFKRK